MKCVVVLIFCVIVISATTQHPRQSYKKRPQDSVPVRSFFEDVGQTGKFLLNDLGRVKNIYSAMLNKFAPKIRETLVDYVRSVGDVFKAEMKRAKESQTDEL